MKTKIFSLFFALIASIGTILAESGTCGENLTWEFADGVLTISGTGEMSDYRHNGSNVAPWMGNIDDITQLVINDGVTNIGDYAFCFCGRLISAVIPNSVSRIGNMAFEYCVSMTSVNIPNSVTSIGAGAFCECRSLTSLPIPSSVISIGRNAFNGCSSLTSIEIPSSVISIGDYAFTGCSGLTSVIVESGNQVYDSRNNSNALFETASDMLMAGCQNTKIPNGIKRIEDSAFYGCSGLTSIDIPSSVVSIGGRAFLGCSKLTSIIIPNGITSIESLTFAGCAGLTSIKIPNSVISIGTKAFLDCRSLTSIDMPNNITDIGWSAFLGCTGLTSVSFPNSITNVMDSAFYDCPNITSPIYNEHVFAYMPNSYSGTYTIPEGIESIVGAAFHNDTNLTCINLPSSLTNIGGGAFVKCKGLTSITIPANIKSIGHYAFDSCTNLTTVYMEPVTPPTLGENVFRGIGSLLSPLRVRVPCGTMGAYKSEESWTQNRRSSRISIGYLTYAIEVYTNDSVFGNVQFEKDSCTSAELEAFPHFGYHFVRWSDGNTDNPRYLELTQDTTLIAVFAIDKSGTCGADNLLKWSFEDKTSTLTISGRGELTQNYTFGIEAPTKMKKLVVSNEVTSIGDSAFYAMTSINHVVIGGNVESIGDYAFAECKNFDDITCYANTVPTINATTFANVGNKQYIYLFVPEERVRAYKRDSYWGQFDVQALSAQQKETTEVATTTTENSVDVTWSSVTGAATYELVIRDKSGNVICTLIFNSAGQLTSIAFMPTRDEAPQKEQTAGFSFTITGLDAGTSYDLTITAKNEAGQELDKKNVSFHTDSPEGIEDLHIDSDQPVKVLMDGHIYILRADHIFDTQGKMIK